MFAPKRFRPHTARRKRMGSLSSVCSVGRGRRSQRRGVAIVESIPCLMVLLIITFGTIEVCAGIYVKQSLVIAAYEGVRAGVGRGTTNQQIIDRAEEILAFRNITWNESDPNYGVFIITPNDAPVDELDALDPITVHIVVPSTGNSSPIFNHMLNRDIDGSATMVREFDPPAALSGS